MQEWEGVTWIKIYGRSGIGMLGYKGPHNVFTRVEMGKVISQADWEDPVGQCKLATVRG